jgi:hypothetical protein
MKQVIVITGASSGFGRLTANAGFGRQRVMCCRLLAHVPFSQPSISALISRG